MPYTTQGYMTPADMADLAGLHDWWIPADDDEPDPECAAGGCDIPDGYGECWRCGAEVVEDPDECECCAGDQETVRRNEFGQCRDCKDHRHF